MDLTDLIRRYTDDHLTGFGDDHRKQLSWSVARFAIWLGRPACLDDFQRSTINPYVDWLRETYSPHTARSQRGNLLCLWRYATREGLTTTSAEAVRRLRMPAYRPTAWTPQEVIALADQASRVPGCFRGSTVRRAPNLRALILADWDTGFRLGDLLRLSPRECANKVVHHIQHKTGIPVSRELHEETWIAIACTVSDDSERERIWPRKARTYQKLIRALVLQLPIRKGSVKWIRRSVSTSAEAARPGDGTKMLGHTRPETAKWYLDRAQLDTPFQAPNLFSLVPSAEKK